MFHVCSWCDQAKQIAEKWRKLAEVATAQLQVATGHLDEWRQRAEAKASALRWQIEHQGCAVSREGETTYECRVDSLCGLCRLRGRAERAEAECERLREQHARIAAISNAYFNGEGGYAEQAIRAVADALGVPF